MLTWTPTEATAAFRVAIAAAGLEPPERIAGDGKLHRFSSNGKRGDDSAWYVLHLDGIPAGAFGCWRSGLSQTWRADTGRRLTPAEEAEQRRRIETAKAQAEAERQQRIARAAALAAEVWRAARPVGDGHPYLLRKGVQPTETLREIDATELAQRIGYRPQARGEPLQGRILIAPVRVGGRLATLELIDEAGRKSALAGGIKKDGYWATAPLPEQGRVVLAEGVATSLSIAEAIGKPAAAAMSVGNLRAAGEAIRRERPGVELVIAADLLKDADEPHPQAVEAARALRCPLAVPDFGPTREPQQTDFNDLHQAAGLDAVRRRLWAAAFVAGAPANDDQDAPAEVSSEPPGLLTLADADELLERAQRALEPDIADGAPPYPVHAMGQLAPVCQAIAEGLQVQPAIVGQSLLATAALLVSGLFDVRGLDGSARPTSLFALTLARSGTGKDTSDKIATHAVRRWQRAANQVFQEALRDFEAAASSRKKGDPPPQPPIAPHRLCADPTVEGLRRAFADGVPAQGLFSTEGGIVLGGYGFSSDHRVKTAATLCALWDSGTLSILRAGGGRTELYDLRLSAHIAVQPVAAQEALNDPLLAHIGLWPRFVLALPPSPEPRRYRPWQPERHPAVVAWWETCDELLALPLPADGEQRRVIEHSPEAQRVLAELFEAMEARAARGGDLWEVRTFALRAAEQAARIAGVLTAVRGRAVVGSEDAAHAAELARYSVTCWQVLLARKASKTSARALELYRWLLGRPGLRATMTDILKGGPRQLRSAEARDQAIEALQQAGLARRDGAVIVLANATPHVTPAKVAKAAKSLDTQGLQAGDAVAKNGESPAPPSAGEPPIRQFSPAVRHGVSLDSQRLSPDSPLSPGVDACSDSPAVASEHATGGDGADDILEVRL